MNNIYDWKIKINFILHRPYCCNNYFYVSVQLFYYKYIFAKAASMETWSDSLKALFFHPAWTPDKKLNKKSNSKNLTKASKRQKYDPSLPLALEIFMVGNFFTSLILQQSLLINYNVSNCNRIYYHVISCIT